MDASIQVFFFMSGHLLWHLFPVVGTGQPSGIGFCKISSSTLWGVATAHDVVHDLWFTALTCIRRCKHPFFHRCFAASLTDPQVAMTNLSGLVMASRETFVFGGASHCPLGCLAAQVVPFSNPGSSWGGVQFSCGIQVAAPGLEPFPGGSRFMEEVPAVIGLSCALGFSDAGSTDSRGAIPRGHEDRVWGLLWCTQQLYCRCR